MDFEIQHLCILTLQEFSKAVYQWPYLMLFNLLKTALVSSRISPADEFQEEVYEIDADPDLIDEQMTRSQADSITKQGFLLKGPDASSERMFAHIGSKSFKRR